MPQPRRGPIARNPHAEMELLRRTLRRLDRLKGEPPDRPYRIVNIHPKHVEWATNTLRDRLSFLEAMTGRKP